MTQKRMVNARLSYDLMEQATSYCAKNDVTITHMLELSILRGMADPDFARIVAEHVKSIEAERRERRLARRRMYRLRKLL